MIYQRQSFQPNPLMNGKIQSHHYDRFAIVYIRQSTLQQVERHGESTKLQYGLVDKAYDLGWPKDRVLVIDDDLGRSGANAEGRPGFQRLVAEVGLDHVGIVLGIEMSRLARSCRDWYQLLEVCALFRTLIGDTDGIYDPASYNDRLLLGLKGTMSEAELHVLKQRMIEGKKAKARRGELGMRLPMGYVKRPSGEIIKDVDEQAQSTIQLVFELFDRFATINAVLKYLVKHNIYMPHREISGLQKGELTWRRPNRITLGNLFHHPLYAGAYVYGRRPTDPRKKKPGRPSTGRTTANPSEWAVLIKDKVPAYITWEQYERNQRQLTANAIQGIGVPRQGSSLLSGLLICGRCGLRMTTRYSTNGSKLCYLCGKMMSSYGEKMCQSLVGTLLDDLIVQQVLAALEPSALDVSLRVAEDIEQERKNITLHWEKQLERAKYEVERAYRQYNSAEPENRLVARTLEKKWDEALSAEERLKHEHAKFIAEQPATLSIAEREAIRQLAFDIPTLWSSSTTTVQERQEIIRLLIERIIVTVEGKTEKVNIEIHWLGGHKTHTQFIRPVAKLEQLSYYQALVDRAVNLRTEGKEFRAIAATLNQEGWRPPKWQKEFNAGMIGPLLSRGGIGSSKKTRAAEVCRIHNEFTLRELSQITNIPEPTLYAQMRKGVLKARRAKEVSHGGIWLITANKQEIKRLQSLKDQPKEWIYHSRVKKVN